MSKYLSSHVAQKELGLRLKAYRINSSLTQEDLAIKSGVSRRSIQNLESGEDIAFSTLVKVLMVLELDSNLELLVPDSTRRPTYFLKTNSQTSRRLRASKKESQETVKEIKWGDESK